MTIADLQVLLNEPKSALAWSGWSERGNHSGHLLNVTALLDSGGITIPGLTVEIEVKANSSVAACLYLFTILQLRERRRVRLFQLEVAPEWKRTHNGLTTVYGPHEHLLEAEPTPVNVPGVHCQSWGGSAHWFLTRTGISAPSLKNPFKP